MSSNSYISRCPVCNELMSCNVSSNPFQNVTGECLNCGFHYWTETGRMDIEEVDALRLNSGEKHITKKHYDSFESEYFKGGD